MKYLFFAIIFFLIPVSVFGATKILRPILDENVVFSRFGCSESWDCLNDGVYDEDSTYVKTPITGTTGLDVYGFEPFQENYKKINSITIFSRTKVSDKFSSFSTNPQTFFGLISPEELFLSEIYTNLLSYSTSSWYLENDIFDEEFDDWTAESINRNFLAWKKGTNCLLSGLPSDCAVRNTQMYISVDYEPMEDSALKIYIGFLFDLLLINFSALGIYKFLV